LPPSWTTLYELTKLDDETFDQKPPSTRRTSVGNCEQRRQSRMWTLGRRAYELFVMAALLERREAEILVERRRFRHLTNVECVRSQFVQRHQGFSFIDF
jgi:hypothetical protein